jgi:hypothetical protein
MARWRCGSPDSFSLPAFNKKGPGFPGPFFCQLYQGSEMLTHQALEMLKRRKGLTKAR